MRLFGIVCLAMALAVFGGCRYCCWGKRASEKRCPTDIRKSHFWCFGEDALFRYPCGPKSEFHGHEPTCWSEWPASATVWRDAHCGPTVGAIIYEERPPAAPGILIPPGVSVTTEHADNGVSERNDSKSATPFLDDGGGETADDELPPLIPPPTQPANPF
jgi:hypothetical protein